MVQNLRAFSYSYIIKIKWIMSVQKKLNVLVSHKNQGRAESKLQKVSPLLHKKSDNLECISIFPGVAKSWRPAI